MIFKNRSQKSANFVSTGVVRDAIVPLGSAIELTGYNSSGKEKDGANTSQDRYKD